MVQILANDGSSPVANGLLRYAGCHAIVPTDGSTASNGPSFQIANDNLTANNSTLEGGPYTATITAVSKGGVFNANTSLPWPIDNTYDNTCPGGLPAWVTAHSATGSQCVQVRGTLPCNAFAGAAEALAQPCPYNSSWGYLGGLQVGDMMKDSAFTGDWEGFMVVTAPTLVTGNTYQWTMQRNANFSYCAYGKDGVDSVGQMQHSNGWGYFMTARDACTGSLILVDINGNNGYVFNQNVSRGHFDLTEVGSQTISMIGSGTQLPDLSLVYPIQFNRAWTQIGQPYDFAIPTGPKFAGYQNDCCTQSYIDAKQFSATAPQKQYAFDFRHYDPAAGGDIEYPGQTLGSATNLTLQAGTAGVYLMTFTGAADIKHQALNVWVGKRYLIDVSSAATGNQITDAKPWTFCYAYNAGECRIGSSSGALYISAPVIDLKTSCWQSQVNLNVPCAFEGPTQAMEATQVYVAGAVTAPNIRQRWLSSLLMGPEQQYVYSKVLPTPDASYLLFTGFLTSGYHTGLMMAKLPPFPGDAVPAATYAPVVVNGAGNNVYVEFGYDEYGSDGVNKFYCTTRAENCRVSGATINESVPFSFAGETMTNANGFSISIPALPGLLLYYRAVINGVVGPTLVALSGFSAIANTTIASIEPTQTQAKVMVLTDRTANCSVRASRGTTLGTQIPDLTDNGATEPRIGWIVNGSQHTIILGSRKANDALAADGAYIVGVTCSPDAEVTQVFQTKPIQWGNTAPDIVPFNSFKFGNMDHPTIDWNGAGTSWGDPNSHSYIDPNTGVEYWLASHPGWISGGIQLAQYAGTWYSTPIDVTGAKWATPANVSSNGSTFSVGSGGLSDPIFIPLTSFANPGGGGSFAGFGGNSVLDDLIFDVYCGNGAVTGITLTLQLGHYNGTSQPVGIGTPITTAACPTTSPVKVGSYPNAGDPTKVVAQPMFKGWGLNGIQRNRVMPPAGTVSVAGSAVTLTGSPTWQNYFSLDWAAGQPILINGAYAHLAAAPSSSTALTIQENLGTLTNVAYTGVDLALLIAKSNSGSNVSVSVGLNYAGSPPPSACCNGDIGMINLAPVSVSKSADGTTCGMYTVGCSAGTLSPALKGYIGQIGSNGGANSVFLYMPVNSDGSPRAETRLLSVLAKPSGSTRVNGNGDTISAPGLSNGIFFDNSDGTAIYGQDQNNTRLWKLTYNEAYGGTCTGYQAFHPYPASGDYNTGNVNVADDCFLWTVITPLAGGKDVKTQIMGTAGNNGTYQSGLNYLGQTVGSAHAGFDLGWMVKPGALGVGVPTVADGGFITIGVAEFQNSMGVVASFGDDGSGKFVIKSIRNTWSEPLLRWGGDHAIPLSTMGTYRFGSIDPLEETGNAGLVFNGRNRATVSQVNRAGFGSPAVWDNTTSLTSNTDFQTCPTGLPAPYASFSSTLNCVQVRINTPFCQVSPNSTYTFPDTKIEKDEFPCTTPGFGVANAAFSKLQDIQVGDWLGSDLGFGAERFVVLTSPVYNSATDITFWLLRTAGYLYLNPTYGGGDETGGAGHSTAGLFNSTHNAGWYLWTIPTIATGAATMDVSNPTNSWLIDNPFRFNGHGSVGRGTAIGLYNFAQGGSACPANSYCGGANLTPTQHITSKLANLATQAPSFAGISGKPIDAMLQSYSSATQDAAVSPYPFFVDFRHINPASGFISMEAYNPFGNAFTMTPVAGTTRTYLVSGDCCVPSPDYKRWGLQAYAGRFWMKDVSGQATLGSAADMPDWSVCLARNVNECVFGSSAGQRYVTVPKHDIQPQCSSSAFGLAAPCVSAFGPWTGQTIQYRIDKYEPTGLMSRKFGFVHAHLGLHYSFSNCRPTPDGQFMFCPGYWLDGVRSEWLALRIGAQPPVDNVNRTTFVPISVNYQGVPSASNIRARFGYAENGGDLLRCTAYGQDCSTEIPSGSPGDPFSFSNEAATRQACVNGANCTITIPSLANRILYYVVDRLDSSGSIVQTGPMQAVAVP